MPMTASRWRKRPKARLPKSATTCSGCANWGGNPPTAPTRPPPPLGSNILVAAGTLRGTTKAAAADLTGGNLVAVEAGLTVSTVNGGTTAAFGYAGPAEANTLA